MCVRVCVRLTVSQSNLKPDCMPRRVYQNLLLFLPPSCVCLLEWQPCYSRSACTLCSLPPQFNVVFLHLNCAAPCPWITASLALCILHGTLPSIMRGSIGLGTSCQSARVCVSVCLLMCVCVCERMCSYALKWEAPLVAVPQQNKSDDVCMHMSLRWMSAVLIGVEGRTHHGWRWGTTNACDITATGPQLLSTHGAVLLPLVSLHLLGELSHSHCIFVVFRS